MTLGPFSPTGLTCRRKADFQAALFWLEDAIRVSLSRMEMSPPSPLPLGFRILKVQACSCFRLTIIMETEKQ